MNEKWNQHAAVLLAAVGCAAVLPAVAAEGPYVGALAGMNKASKQTYDWEGSQTILPIPQQPIPVEDGMMKNSGEPIADYDYKAGLAYGFVGGYSFANGLRPEFELDFRSDKPKDINFLTTGAVLSPDDSTNGVRLESTTVFGNLWYDFFPSWRVRPYLGGGIGMTRYKLKNFKENVVATSRHTDGTIISVVLPSVENTRTSNDAKFAYQGGAGLRFDLTEQFTLGLDYRYVKGGTGKFYVYRLQPETHFDADYEGQTLFLSLSWNFRPNKPVAQPQPVAAPVAVVSLPPDTDGDGVADDADKCPNSQKGEQVDAVGCPLPPPCKSPEPGQRIDLSGCAVGYSVVLKGVNFDFDKATLTLNARSILDGVVDALNVVPDVHVEIGGHTDSRGSDAYNQKLSEARAQSVVQYLTEHGIEASRMTAVGYGETQPIADNDSDEGREINRRVELKITSGSTEVPASQEPPATSDNAAPEASSSVSAAGPESTDGSTTPADPVSLQ